MPCRFYHGSPQPGLRTLEPRLDPRLGITGIFVSDEPPGPMLFSLLPNRANSAVSYSTKDGKLLWGFVFSPKPLLEQGCLYMVESAAEDVIESTPGQLHLNAPVSVISCETVKKEIVLPQGWVVCETLEEFKIMVDNQHHKDFAIDFAKRAGAIIRQNFTLGMKRELKSDNSPVTETDLAINRILLEEVRRRFPEHSILAEEQSDLRPGAEFTWVCDPVDGTIPFSHGIPTCVFALALLQEGKPILAVVYDPFIDRLFVAEKGKGATMNGERIRVSEAKSFERTVIGFSYADRYFDSAALFADLRKEKAYMVNVGSTIYMGMLVAAGELSAYVFSGVKPHDSATVQLLVEEAGGKATDVFGNEQRYDGDVKGIIASNKHLHDKFVRLVRNRLL